MSDRIELARRPLSLHPGDDCLEVVLSYLPRDTYSEFVTWVVNAQNEKLMGPGTSDRLYFADIYAAVDNYYMRSRADMRGVNPRKTP